MLQANYKPPLILLRMPQPVVRAALALALTALLAVAACGPDNEADHIVVLAAASLTEVLGEIGAGFEESAGIHVSFSYGGSDTLAGQVRKGAPADAVIFAGAGPLDGLEAAGLTRAGSRRDVAANRLVVIFRAGSGVKLSSLDELATRHSGKVAIADPQLAPAGRYARSALETAGIWEQLESRVIPGLDVRNAAAAVTAGNAQFGIVYETDAAAVEGVEVALVVPSGLYPPIVYPAAVVGASKRPTAAAAFLEYLGAADARTAFARHGFRPPP